MIKVYEADGRIISQLTLIVNQRPVIVSFEPTSIYARYNSKGSAICSQLRTNNPAIQAALESHPSFGHSYRLAAMIPEAKPEPKAAAEDTAKDSGRTAKVVKAASPAEARDWLKENCKVMFRGFVSVAQIKEKAAEYGIEFEGI